MNFINNIKDTIGNVSNSLKSQNASSKSDSFEFAGAELLLRFQSQWKAIHNSNQHNAHLAADCDQLIKKICQRTNERADVVRRFHFALKNLPFILEQVNITHTRLKKVSDQCDKLEQDLITLQCINIESTFSEERRRRSEELKAYSLLRQAQSNKITKEIAAGEVERIEGEMRERLKERHLTFQQEHHLQMQHYKLTGFIPLNDEIRINKVEASLNEMPLNLDKDELEEFLKEEDEEDDDDRS